MGNKFEKQLEPEIENREKERPEISYHFLYSVHVRAKDFKNLKKALEKADIYIPESLGWKERHKKEFEDLCQGKITPQKLLEEYFEDEKQRARFKESTQFREWEIIYNSKKAILLADIPFVEADEFIDRLDDCSLLKINAHKLFTKGYFKESLDKYRSYFEGFAKLQLEREKKIKENLDREVDEFIKANPEYTQKEKLKVLVRLGMGHTKIYQDLKKEGKDISREFSQLPLVYLHSDEAVRRITFNKELSDETIVQATIGDILYFYLRDLTEDSNKLYKISRQLSSLLTANDIEKISQNLGRSASPDQNITIKEIEKFGIKLPKSEKEIDEMLETYYK